VTIDAEVASAVGSTHAGLSAPLVHPRRLPTSTGPVLRKRARQIAVVATKHFGPLAIHQARGRAIDPTAFARPLRLTFEELGATFMKFGQLVGSAPGVFGEEVANEFRSCLDTGAPVPFEEVRDIVELELGLPLHEGFADFEVDPIGRASIAVVHRARLHDGRTVAVKVLRPTIERRVAVDLDLLQPMLEIIARQTGDTAAGNLLQMFDGFRVQIGEELDLRNELRAMEHYRELLALVDLPNVTVPEVHPELSGRTVLTMEFLDGVPIDDLSAIAAFGHDPRPIVHEVVKGFLLTAIRWGTFHGDVHAGNLLMLRDGRIGVIDWGIVGRLDPEGHRFFRRLIEAALGDESAWDDIGRFVLQVYGPALKEGLQMDDEGVVAFIRMMMEPLLTQPFGQVSLADLMNAPIQKVAEVRGYEAHDRSVLTLYRRFKDQRRLRAMLDEHGGYGTDFDRGQFLLSKQLMYFERYGKMFFEDVSLFEDRAFFEQALAQAPS
jgi:predicted unusual protein kinase regulating ubiquinone biosynthesis (AarF/ABC1/UbiB family)